MPRDTRLLPNNNLPDLCGDGAAGDAEGMSPLKRLQRLKQNGSLRLTSKGRGAASKRTLNFPADVQNVSGSDTSLSDREGRVERRISSDSDLSLERSPLPREKSPLPREKSPVPVIGTPLIKSCVKGSNGNDNNGSTKSVRFEDTDSVYLPGAPPLKLDSNGNVGSGPGNMSGASTGELKPPELPKAPPPAWNRGLPAGPAKTMASDTEAKEPNDVDSETGEVKLDSTGPEETSPKCTCNEKPKKPAVPSKPPNLQRLKARPASVHSAGSSSSGDSGCQGNLETPRSGCQGNLETPRSSCQVNSETPRPVSVVSVQKHGEVSRDGKGQENTVTVNYTPVPKPVIEVKLVQRRSVAKSQTPSPSLKHSTIKARPPTEATPEEGLLLIQQRKDENGRWLSRSVDELDRDEILSHTHGGPEDPTDIYACPTSFLRDPNSKLRHSFIDRNLTEKERQAIINSVGDVQTLLRNSFASDDEKIYSLPQPACYGDNTLKAVKKITEKYDTLQRRKLRALSFREGDKSSGTGASFSQPASPVSPTELSGMQPPRPPSVPPPLPSTGPSLDSVDGGGCGRAPGPPPTPPPRSSSSPTPSPPSSPAAPAPAPGDAAPAPGVTARDTARLDLFYRGRDTDVVVCRCLAELRFGTATHSGATDVSDWSPVLHTGVPLLVLNTGHGKRRRELLLTIAERETGFPLWSDKINYLSNYRAEEERTEDGATTTHVIQVSNNLKKVAGLAFHCATAAKDFLDKFREITKNPNDDLWKVSCDTGNARKNKKRRPFSFKRMKPKRPGKADISVPCNFAHITSIDPQDRALFDCLNDVSRQLSRSLPNSPTGSRPVSFTNS